MNGYFGEKLLLALSGILIGFLAGCGNSGGNNATPVPQHQIEGKTIKGPVQNAAIQVYTLTSQGYRDSVIGQGTTRSDGSFNLQATATGGPVALVVASGGDYIDEATGHRVAIPSWVEISAMVPWPSDTTGLIMTPLTRMAAEQALNRVLNGENPLTALDNAKRNVTSSFALSGVDISETVPADPTSSSSAGLSRGNPELEYGLALAALSQMTKDWGMDPSVTLDLIQNIVDDISDGAIDNVGRNGGALPNMLSITPVHAVDGLETYINSFLRGSRNATGIQGAAPPPPSNPPVTTAPSTPTGVTVTPGDGALTVSWSASSGASWYNVYISLSSGTGYVLRASIGNTYLLDTGLTNGTVYYYVVTAVNSYGESAVSAEVNGTPFGQTGIPSAPTGVSATAGYASVTVSWAPVTGATSYKVYHSAQSGVGTGGTQTACPGTPCVISGLTNNIWYYFTISAVNSYGEGPLSTEIYAMPTGPSFTDSNLATCFSNAMGGLTNINLLVGLDCVNKSISNLSGIEALTGLQLLNLRGNLITNVTPIASLTGLTDLDLSNNLITTGVGTLATSLVNLQNVVIHCNASDILANPATCSDTNGTGIPCSELQSLISAASFITQPTLMEIQAGVNCH